MALGARCRRRARGSETLGAVDTTAAQADSRPTRAAPKAGLPCVYYDGACPLCSREIAAYQRARGGDQLAWVDAADCAPTNLGPQLDREQALARLHVRLPDGRLLSGARAFVAVWQRMPAFRGLARLARVPGATLAMEGLYRLFLAVRPWWRPPVHQPLAWPGPSRRELRTDHAGEAGAVMIYRGVLAITRDPALRAFAHQHLETERKHLALLEAVVPAADRSRLLPLWRLAGWFTGALPALFGAQPVYATIEAVETFVDAHYSAQLRLIDGLRADAADPADNAVGDTAQASEAPPDLAALRRLLEGCRLDEVAHRDEARALLATAVQGRATAPPSRRLRAWVGLVSAGSAFAVRLSRHV